MINGMLQEPVAYFLLILSVILLMPLLSERLRLPGIVGIIIGGILIGPYGLRILDVGDRIEFLATIGLVYLMFSAGLEVDIQQFKRVRYKAMVFGLFTYAIPQIMGMGVGLLLGMSWLGAVLLGSAFSSHTLIAFPILTRLGLTRNESVSITAGATVMTDIIAFIVLAVVLGARDGTLEAIYFVRLFILLVVFALIIFLVLPRVNKLIMKHFTIRAVEFQFVMVILLITSFGARLIGVHEVVGAFLAGLAINASLPRHSPVIGHVLFIGESLFIPIFLLYSGMITDPLVFTEGWKTILTAACVIFVAYVSKWMAAMITARLFKFSFAEKMVVYGLSHAQAAVTIPTLVIGLDMGLFDRTLFNAAILMVLLTSVSSPMLVQRHAPQMHKTEQKTIKTHIFERVLVPVVDLTVQEHLLNLGSLLANSVSGKLIILNVVRDQSSNMGELSQQRVLLDRIPGILSDPDVDIELIPRVDTTFSQGILHTVKERDITLIIMGWRGKRSLQQSILGTILDEVVWKSDRPMIVAKLIQPLNSIQKVVLLLPARIIDPGVVRRMLEVNIVLAKALNVRLHVLVDASYLAVVQNVLEKNISQNFCDIEPLVGAVNPERIGVGSINNMIVIPGFGSRRRYLSSTGHLPEQIAASYKGNVVILHFDR